MGQTNKTLHFEIRKRVREHSENIKNPPTHSPRPQGHLTLETHLPSQPFRTAWRLTSLQDSLETHLSSRRQASGPPSPNTQRKIKKLLPIERLSQKLKARFHVIWL